VKRALLTFLVAGFACDHHVVAPTVDASSDSAREVVEVADVASPPLVIERWQDAMHEERYADALTSMGPAQTTDPPITRFARARAAVETHDAPQALEALDGLEPALPLLADEIARLRARAKAQAGPFGEAGDWFASKPSAADQLDAGRAYENAKDNTKARTAAAHVISANKRARKQEADARALRIRVRDGYDADVIADAKWLFVHGADVAAAKDATVVIDAQHLTFTPADWIERAHVLADAGRGDDAVAAFDRSLKPHEKKPRDKADLLVRARAHYDEAARLYKDAFDAKHSAEDLVSSARALSRQNKDVEAIARYDDAIKQFPQSPQADDAAFLAARLTMLLGQWANACTRLDEYASKYSHEKKEAARLRGIAHLLNGDAKIARKLLEEAAGAEKDESASARLTVLAAQAALADGDNTHAIARWTDVAKQLPLTWPALMARAHLAAVHAPLPPMIDTGSTATLPATPAPPPLPPPVDLLHQAGLDDDAEQALRSRESVVAAAWPTRSDEALCRAYAELDRADRRFQLSNSVPKLPLANAPTAATRWAWGCVYPAPFSRLISRLETDEKLPVGLVHAVMRQESGFDPDVVSPARAIGLMQLMPETAATLALELDMLPNDDALFVPSVNVRFGARYLRNMIARLRSVPLSVAAYNAGPEAIERWLTGMTPSTGAKIQLDAFVEAIPYAETRLYVVKVMSSMARYGYLAAGDAGVPVLDLEP